MRTPASLAGLTLFALLLLPSVLGAQMMDDAPDQDGEPEGPTVHVVPGQRHGVSYFPFVRYPEVEYEPGDELTFDRYHTKEVMYAWMRRWAEEHPNLVEIVEVGRSFGDQPLLQATVTNRETGPATDKPAAFFEGGRHSGEVTSSESVLWLMQHLVEGYGTDPEITRLLDTRAIYLRPQNNPDGSDMYLKSAQANRSTVRPVDNDGDGLLDEDPDDDLDGDGVIYEIRWRPREGTDDEATHVVDERDRSGRLLRRARDGEEAVWVVEDEGIDNDGDGRWNEDGIGGLDLHRNYPENWRPDSGRDRTGRGYTQFGAGAFPLSEPETRSVVLWVLEHPNISVANSMDTRVPMHLRPPSTSRSEERMYPEDLRYYETFDSLGLTITDYPWAGDVYETYMTRYDTTLSGQPREPRPLFGHGPDFGYFYLGAIWYGDELWNNGAMEDVNGDGRLDAVDALAWDDEANGGRGFREWEPFEHPTLGPVEIGGFHPKFFSQNGPPEVLESWVRKQALFNKELALHLPELAMDGVSAVEVDRDGDTVTWDLNVTWTNVGRLPTALRQAQLVKIVREDRAVVAFDDEVDEGPDARVEILRPEWDSDTVEVGWTEPGETRTATFRIRVRGDEAVTGTVRVLSTRGGVLEQAFTLGAG
jgi:hypothetical protein